MELMLLAVSVFDLGIHMRFVDELTVGVPLMVVQ
jgi:hypothetical protein